MAYEFCPMPELRRWRWPQFGVGCLLMIVVVVAVFALVASWLAAWLTVPANRFIIRNASGVDLDNVKLTIGYGSDNKSWTMPRLMAGSSETMIHEFNDLSAGLTFEIDGAERRFDNGHIDLWTGEGWVFEIQPDGSVKEEYDIPDLPPR
jgi:hypothetical protein